MIQIYTGNGKGKTTAALGLGLRAVGHGLKVIMIQFMKGEINYGELEAVKYLPDFKIEQYGRPDFVNPENPDKEDIRLAEQALKRAVKVIKNKEFDIVILDEINVAVSFGLIKAEKVIELIKNTSKKTELILTGRYMPEEFIKYADLISEVREVKHHFHDGVPARKGIEY
ncbi:MAG: cob(I)yrinic acid a,c-diamide adenosyltransferase [Candidatus Stahlbacteria bacterium]|nr:MAG: cob(I)yrinic acid a,c-diamide adenosyltransferase [Candidatus Stahlbacteria bacterium]